MVGEGTEIRVGHRSFWNSPLLNVEQCGDMINNWLALKGRGEEFYNINEARAGDAVAFGSDRWKDWTFAIFLSTGRVASTMKVKGCNGKIVTKLLIIRVQGLEAQGRSFVGGVHIWAQDHS